MFRTCVFWKQDKSSHSAFAFLSRKFNCVALLWPPQKTTTSSLSTNSCFEVVCVAIDQAKRQVFFPAFSLKKKNNNYMPPTVCKESDFHAECSWCKIKKRHVTSGVFAPRVICLPTGIMNWGEMRYYAHGIMHTCLLFLAVYYKYLTVVCTTQVDVFPGTTVLICCITKQQLSRKLSLFGLFWILCMEQWEEVVSDYLEAASAGQRTSW